LLSSLVLSGSVGALYTQATVLPFILMERVGLTPSQFGAGMLMQSGMYFAGTLAMRQLLGRFGAFRLVPVGLAFIGLGSIALAVTLRAYEPSFLGVMGPVALFSFGIAFVIPATATATLAPFPHIAGAASSMSGFFQMGGGLLGGLICAAMGDPVLAMATVIPAMGLLAILSWALWTRLPTPKAASVVQAAPVDSQAE
jgi:DHA1 family bicyclomycin/chloramphenicol resistance-like MFS transporter